MSIGTRAIPPAVFVRIGLALAAVPTPRVEDRDLSVTGEVLVAGGAAILGAIIGGLLTVLGQRDAARRRFRGLMRALHVELGQIAEQAQRRASASNDPRGTAAYPGVAAACGLR